MSVEITAAIWGGISGAVLGTLGSLAVLLISRYLRTRGEIRFDPDDWTFWYRGDYEDHEGFPRSPTIAPHDKRIDAATRAEYGFTAEFFNDKDIAVALRDVTVAFLLKGREKFSDRPLDAGGEHTASRQVGTVHLPSRIPVIVQMSGTITDDHKLVELITGCDEARLRATRENDDACDWRIARITTTFRRT